jgi:hypothetical protein
VHRIDAKEYDLRVLRTKQDSVRGTEEPAVAPHGKRRNHPLPYGRDADLSVPGYTDERYAEGFEKIPGPTKL